MIQNKCGLFISRARAPLQSTVQFIFAGFCGGSAGGVSVVASVVAPLVVPVAAAAQVDSNRSKTGTLSRSFFDFVTYENFLAFGLDSD